MHRLLAVNNPSGYGRTLNHLHIGEGSAAQPIPSRIERGYGAVGRATALVPAAGSSAVLFPFPQAFPLRNPKTERWRKEEAKRRSEKENGGRSEAENKEWVKIGRRGSNSAIKQRPTAMTKNTYTNVSSTCSRICTPSASAPFRTQIRTCHIRWHDPQVTFSSRGKRHFSFEKANHGREASSPHHNISRTKWTLPSSFALSPKRL